MAVAVKDVSGMHVPTEDRENICSDGLLSVPEASKFLGVSRAFLYQLMERGKLPYVRIGRARRVPKKALVQLAAECLVPGRPY